MLEFEHCNIARKCAVPNQAKISWVVILTTLTPQTSAKASAPAKFIELSVFRSGRPNNSVKNSWICC